ncbi:MULTISPECIES: hypothetical protein [Marinobacter]|nr:MULTISPECIES: hypothetical protein [Marinobacter]
MAVADHTAQLLLETVGRLKDLPHFSRRSVLPRVEVAIGKALNRLHRLTY